MNGFPPPAQTVMVYVVTSADLLAHTGVDLVDWSKAKAARVWCDTMVRELRDRFVAAQHGGPVRIWQFTKRKNGTWRPTILLKASEYDEVDVAKLMRPNQLSVRLFVDTHTGTAPVRPDDILVFIKLYSAMSRSLSLKSWYLVDRRRRLQEYEDLFRENVGVDPATSLLWYEMISYDPPRVDRQSTALTFAALEMDSGDILCCCESVPFPITARTRTRLLGPPRLDERGAVDLLELYNPLDYARYLNSFETVMIRPFLNCKGPTIELVMNHKDSTRGLVARAIDWCERRTVLPALLLVMYRLRATGRSYLPWPIVRQCIAPLFRTPISRIRTERKEGVTHYGVMNRSSKWWSVIPVELQKANADLVSREFVLMSHTSTVADLKLAVAHSGKTGCDAGQLYTLVVTEGDTRTVIAAHDDMSVYVLQRIGGGSLAQKKTLVLQESDGYAEAAGRLVILRTLGNNGPGQRPFLVKLLRKETAAHLCTRLEKTFGAQVHSLSASECGRKIYRWWPTSNDIILLGDGELVVRWATRFLW